MADKIKIAVLGCSAVAARSVIPALLNNDRFQLLYVASRSPEKAQEFAGRFNCKPCGYQDLLGYQEIDAVYVSLPVGMHYEWGKKVLQSRRHLLMEKTFTTQYKMALDLIEIAKENDVVAMEALMYVYHPLYTKVQSILQSGKIGKIRYLEAYFGFPSLSPDNIRNNFDLGGGGILDALIYPLSFCFNIAGAPCRSYHYHIFCDPGQAVDARGFMQLDFDDISAHIGYGFGLMYRNNYVIWGSQGCLHADRVFGRPPDMKNDLVISTQNGQENIPIEPADHFQNMLHAFADKINKTDKSHLNEGKNILSRMEIISEMKMSYDAKIYSSSKQINDI